MFLGINRFNIEMQVTKREIFKGIDLVNIELKHVTSTN